MILLIPIAMRFEAREYQKTAIAWVQDHPRCLLFLDMGLGKTVSTLTAFMELQAYGEAERMLVVAPKKVAESTWSDECAKWEHLRGLRVSVVLGERKRREAALREDADVYVTSRDNFVWLCEHYRNRLPFDMVVLDELSSFKTPGSLRFKAADRWADGHSGAERTEGPVGAGVLHRRRGASWAFRDAFPAALV